MKTHISTRRLVLTSLLACSLVACTSPNGRNGGSGGAGGTGAGSGGAGGTGAGGSGGSTGVPGMNGVPQNCPSGGTTTVTGKVFAPNGTLPLYNAIVYIPATTPAAFTDGVTCDVCNGNVSGDPQVSALTGPDGSFTLMNSPWGANLPLVVQLGKWRVQTTIPNVTQCGATAVDASLTTLPSDHTKGDMPKMAIATGSADPFECLLLKIGIDPTEIQPTGKGTRIEFFTGANSPGTTMAGAQSATTITTNLTSLLNYDILMLPCEGDEFVQQGTDSIVNYVNMGGRLFTTHFSYDWLTYPNSPFNVVTQTPVNGMWDKNQMDYPMSDTATTEADLVTTFPKGLAFSQWLTAVGATSPPGKLDVVQIRHDIDDVNASYAQEWATDTMTDGKPGVAHLTFNTPINTTGNPDTGPMICGRVVYSDFHVVATSTGHGHGGTGTFPTACKGGAMTDQEKALAFMLFDLSSCVQPDQTPPMPIQ